MTNPKSKIQTLIKSQIPMTPEGKQASYGAGNDQSNPNFQNPKPKYDLEERTANCPDLTLSSTIIKL